MAKARADRLARWLRLGEKLMLNRELFPSTLKTLERIVFGRTTPVVYGDEPTSTTTATHPRTKNASR